MLLIFQCRCRLNREPVNPRPTQEAAIAWRQKAHAFAGIGTYNEGCHDDVNKHVWLSIFWGCDVSATGVSDGCSTKAQGEAATGQKALLDLTLHDYARVHFGSLLADSVAAGIYALEQNWVGVAAANEKSGPLWWACGRLPRWGGPGQPSAVSTGAPPAQLPVCGGCRDGLATRRPTPAHPLSRPAPA